MTHTPRSSAARIWLAAAALALAGPLACSFSYSSDSISDSSKSVSDSSKSSSGEDTARFLRDVEQYTVAFLRARGGSAEGFLAGLGDLARRRGVSDWEAEPATWEAIGRGLGRAQVADAERVAYEHAWAGGDAAKLQALGRGHAAVN
jgi:hypothetical protein